MGQATWFWSFAAYVAASGCQLLALITVVNQHVSGLALPAQLSRRHVARCHDAVYDPFPLQMKGNGLGANDEGGERAAASSSSSRPSKTDLYSNEELKSLLELHLDLSNSTFASDENFAPPGSPDDQSYPSLHDLVVQATTEQQNSESDDAEGGRNNGVEADPKDPVSLFAYYRGLLENDPTLRSKLADVRMIASDVDGTLLTSTHDVHPRTLAAMRRAVRAIQQGSSPPSSSLQHFCLATGKSRAGALGSLGPEISALLSQVPGVFIQGLYCVDATGRVLFEQKLGDVEVKELEEIAHEHGLSVIAYDGDALYATASSLPKHVLEVHDKYGEPKPKVLESLGDHPNGFHKVLIMTDDVEYLEQEFRPKMEALAQTYNSVVTRAIPSMLELLPPGCSKALGVQKLCEALEIHPEREMLAIGDGENDVEMLQFAAVGVAMGNAVPEARQAADVVLEETNDNGGAGVAIELFGLRDILH